MTSFTIGLVQERFSPEREENLKRAVAGIRAAHKKGAQIICLPELFLSQYFCTTESHANFELAEPYPGPVVDLLSPVARELGIVIVVPFFERRAAGVYHNSVTVLDADGSPLGVYRKMHIPDDPLYYEKFYFTPGDSSGEGVTNGGFRVFKTKFATLGVLICWDQWYPEGARITSLLGAEVLFYPTAIGWHPKEKAEFGAAQVDAWQTMQRAHAIANGIYVGAVNRVGHEPTPGTEGIEFFGQSFVADPFGRIVTHADESKSEILVWTCERETLETTRQHWPFLRDRRVDAYSPITSRFLGSK